MLTGRLLHAARILAGLDREDLATRAGLRPGDVARMEETDAGPIAGSDGAAAALVTALRRAGVEIRPDDGPSLRLRSLVVDQGMRPEALNAENDD